MVLCQSTVHIVWEYGDRLRPIMEIKLRTIRTTYKHNVLIKMLIVSEFIHIGCYKHKFKKYCSTLGTY